MTAIESNSTSNESRQCIENSMRQQQKNITRVKKYELQRVKSYTAFLKDFIEDLSLIAGTMREYVIKLSKLKTFLIERSTIEKEYGHRLKQLSRKWLYAGLPSSGSGAVSTSKDITASERDSFEERNSRTSFGNMSSTDAATTATASIDRNGFFYLVNSTSLEVGENIESFGTMMSGSLCQGKNYLRCVVTHLCINLY